MAGAGKGKGDQNEGRTKMNVKRLAAGGLLLAMGILVPQAFHFTGVPASGAVFLPMHIPVLIAGFLLGPLYGLIIGMLSPIISAMTTGMPAIARLPFMIGELATYGAISGLLFEQLGLYKRRFGIYISLLGAMLVGRIVYGLMIVGAIYLFGVKGLSIGMVGTAIITGIPGIVIQVVCIPVLIMALKKGGVLSDIIRQGKKAS